MATGLMLFLWQLERRPARSADGYFDPKELRRRELEKNSKLARSSYEEFVKDVCRAVEAVAQSARKVEAGGAQAEDVRSMARSLLLRSKLEDSLASAEILVGAEGAAARRVLVVEALESLQDGLRNGVLEGARQQRVVARLRLLETQLLEFLACLPQSSVRSAQRAVEQENAGNVPEYAGLFPWRTSSDDALRRCPERGGAGDSFFLADMDAGK